MSGRVHPDGGAEVARFLEALGRDPAERLSICHKPPGGTFVAEVTTVADAGHVVARHADECCWYGTAVLDHRVTTGRGTVADVIGVRELAVDLDFKPGGMPSIEAASAVIDTLSSMLGARPVAVVHTGHGIQPHWALEPGDGTDWHVGDDAARRRVVALWRRWGRLVAAVAERHGGAADGIWDLARVLRCPATVNTKNPTDPRPVTVDHLIGAPVTLERLADTLDEYGIPERPGDADVLGEVQSPPGEWRWGERTCGYVAKMVDAWHADTPEARHPWLMSQTVRLAAAHRLGCITEHDHEHARRTLADRFRWLVANTGERREPQPGEIPDAFAWGTRKAAAHTDADCRRELGDHDHIDHAGDLLAVGDPNGSPESSASGRGRFFDRGGLRAVKLVNAAAGAGSFALGPDGSIWTYRHGVYRDDPGALVAVTRDLLGDRWRRMHHDTATTLLAAHLAEHGLVLGSSPIDRLVNVANGMLDPLTGTLHPHDPKHLSFAQLPVAWDPAASCPRFDAWLAERSGAQADDLLEAIGLVLTPQVGQRKVPFLIGPTRSGKGTLLRVLEALVGPRDRASVTLHDLATNRFAAAQLHGKILNSAGDLSDHHIEDLSIFKMLTGDDAVTGEHKFRQAFSFRNSALFVFSANTAPTVSETSRAYLARVRPYVFPTSFEGHEDQQVERDLLEEIPGVLVRLVEAVQRWHTRGGYAPANPIVEDFFARSSDPVAMFTAQALEPSTNGFASSVAVFDAYKSWCIANGHKQMGRNKFLARAENTLGPRQRQNPGTSTGPVGWHGWDVLGEHGWGESDGYETLTDAVAARSARSARFFPTYLSRGGDQREGDEIEGFSREGKIEKNAQNVQNPTTDPRPEGESLAPHPAGRCASGDTAARPCVDCTAPATDFSGLCGECIEHRRATRGYEW